MEQEFDDRLLGYIDKWAKRGADFKSIKTRLIGVGWAPERVDLHIQYYSSQNQLLGSKVNYKQKSWIISMLPIILLLTFLLILLKFGPFGLLRSAVSPNEKLFIENVVFSPDQITFDAINDGAEILKIAQVRVNEAYWQFEISPEKTLEPLQKARINVAYPWIAGDTEKIEVISGTGSIFEKVIDGAEVSPTINFYYIKRFVLLGFYVGGVPIFLGMLWFPILRKLHQRWYSFLLSLTVGMLVFLGFDALTESFDLVGALPHSFNGVGVMVLGFLLALLTLFMLSYKTESLKQGEEHNTSLLFGYFIALGLGIHNLGEGLAVGRAHAVGGILSIEGIIVAGLMIRNITEGIVIVAPLSKHHKQIKNFLYHLAAMGLIAAMPMIIGSLIGGFFYSPVLSVFFLAVGAGAIFDITFDMMHYMAQGRWLSLLRLTNIIGFLSGILITILLRFI